MQKSKSAQNIFKKIAVAMGVVFFALFMGVLPQDSRADKRDSDLQDINTPTKSADENKDQNKDQNKDKDENKKDKDEEENFFDQGPLAYASVTEVSTANPNANAETKAILNYLTALPLKEDNRVISGQFIGHAAKPNSTYTAEAYQELVTDLEISTGESIGMVGVDYAQLTNSNPSIDLELTNQPIIDQWNEGGLVTVSWHTRNPWTGGGSRDKTINGDFADIMKAGTAANQAFMQELDQTAEGLLDLQNHGVSVLWRPFHEANGNGFWWGGGRATASELKALWIYVFDYFKNVKELNNLLWVYSVVPKTSSTRAEDAHYPGSQYVDIVGLDFYGSDLKLAASSYKKLISLKKPFGFTEFGPYKGSDADKDPSLLEPHYSYVKLIEGIKKHTPKAVFFQAWNHGHSMALQLDADKLLKDSWITDARDWQ